MMSANRPQRLISRGFQMCVLMCAMVVLPLGIASAQDYEAVGKRLKKSVKKGEITQQHADAMMGALKKEATEGKSQSKSNEYLENSWKKLQAMVQKGDLTKEQAIAKMSAIKKGAIKKGPAKKEAGKKEAGKKDAGADRATAYLMNVKKKLGVAVEAGEITKEDAAKKFKAASAGVKKRLADADRQTQVKQDKDPAPKPDQARTYLMQVRNKLGEAVKAGKMSREDAEKKYKAAEEGIKKKMEMGNRREKVGNEKRPVRGRGDKKKIGKLTEKETEAKWVEVKLKAADRRED